MKLVITFFDDGQIYVALSRVTKLDGLHLINFDPSSIKVNSDAIEEYNRLRNIVQNKKNIALPTLEKKKNNALTVKDDEWTVSEKLLRVQQDSDLDDKDIKGIPTEDSASSYAKVVFLLLFHNDCIRKKIFNLKDLENDDIILQNLFIKHRHEGIVLDDIINLKKKVNIAYGLNLKEDVSEFLSRFIEKSNVLQKLLNHDMKIKKRCVHCKNYRQVQETKNYIISLLLPPQKNKESFDLQFIFDYNIGFWKDQEKLVCPNCKKSTIIEQ